MGFIMYTLGVFDNFLGFASEVIISAEGMHDKPIMVVLEIFCSPAYATTTS